MQQIIWSILAVTATIAFYATPTSVVFSLEPQRDKVINVPGEAVYDIGDEPMRYIENDRVKLGLNLLLGGAITYLEDKQTQSGNMINCYDWGRQIQLSYYSGPNPYVGPNGEKPAPEWAGLGWNPIQSGDCGGFRSQVLSFERISDSELFVRARPMLWPNHGVPAECVFECKYKLTENGFVLEATIVNNRTDKTQYQGRNQETPAVYTNAPWYKLVSYLGDKPFENEPLTTLVDKSDGKGWPWVIYYAPERWHALVNDKGYGLGVYQPCSTEVSAGFHGGDAAKGQSLGPDSTATGYIAPRETTILDWNIKRTYRTTFIVGSIDEIRSTVYKLAKTDIVATPDWVFQTDRQNWCYLNATDEGYPIVNCLKLNLQSSKQAIAQSPVTFWKAQDARTLTIDASFESEPNASGVEETATVCITPVSPADAIDYLQWSEGTKNKDQDRLEKSKTYPRLESIYVNIPVKYDGVRRELKIDLSAYENYKGAMKRVEIFFPKRDGKATIYRIGFNK